MPLKYVARSYSLENQHHKDIVQRDFLMLLMNCHNFIWLDSIGLPWTILIWKSDIDGLVQEWSNFIANALELHLSCINPSNYRKTSNIRCTLVGNKIVDHSDVIGASPVGAAPTTSSFLTLHMASRDSAKTAARQYGNILSVEIWCVLH